MDKTTIAGGTALLALVALVLTQGYRVFERDVEPTAAASVTTPSEETAVEYHPSFLYGRVTTYGGTTYEGRLRWGGEEETFWDNYFNGVKDENPWAAYLPPAELTEKRRSFEIFGFKFFSGERQINLDRPLMVRYGDIVRIEAHGEGIDAALERGINYDPIVRVKLKSDATVNLDRLSAGDFDDGVRVWDPRHGIVDLGPRQIRTIELFSPAGHGNVPNRLHGSVHTQQGSFTGFIQWNRVQTVGTDELVGYDSDGRHSLRFDAIRSIARNSRNNMLITLLDGRTIELTERYGDGNGNKGTYVDDPRYGRVLVSWDAFERLDFSPGGSGPTYDSFPPGEPITGTVTTGAGRRLTGRLVFDLDESETIETLDAPAHGVDYTIPFGYVASIALAGCEGCTAGTAGVTLHSGEVLHLEHTGDLGNSNAGLLVFVDGLEHPEYVPWADVKQIDLDRPSAMYVPFSNR